jgi:hypothetical protein
MTHQTTEVREHVLRPCQDRVLIKETARETEEVARYEAPVGEHRRRSILSDDVLQQLDGDTITERGSAVDMGSESEGSSGHVDVLNEGGQERGWWLMESSPPSCLIFLNTPMRSKGHLTMNAVAEPASPGLNEPDKDRDGREVSRSVSRSESELARADDQAHLGPSFGPHPSPFAQCHQSTVVLSLLFFLLSQTCLSTL